jgi:cytochrome c553
MGSSRATNRSRLAQALLRSLAGIVGLAVLWLVTVFLVSEWRLRREHFAPLVPLAAGTPDPVEGRRMARILGCWAGCHGMEGQGGAEELEGIVRVTAPTLSEVLPHYSDAQLVRLIRYGVKRDGHSALGMTSYTFWPISDADLADVIAHLRAQPASPPVPRERHITLAGRFALAVGRWKTSADAVDRAMPRWGELPRTTPYERGRYLASIVCSECHGLDFRGDPLNGGPSLAIMSIYSIEQFRHLLRTGEPIGGRDLGIMSWVARNAFVDFTDPEIADIHAFLTEFHGGARTQQATDAAN